MGKKKSKNGSKGPQPTAAIENNSIASDQASMPLQPHVVSHNDSADTMGVAAAPAEAAKIEPLHFSSEPDNRDTFIPIVHTPTPVLSDDNPRINEAQGRNREGSTEENSQYKPIKQQQQQQTERAAPRQYEDDDEDYQDHRNPEQTPLLHEASRDSNDYSSDEESEGDRGSQIRRRGRGQGRGRSPQQHQPTTWIEWAVQYGLHPRTWTCQTFIKATLLVTLLTLVVLSFTVFRIQDHIKDILKYIDHHKQIGAVLFILSYTAACTLFLPGSLFTVGAGFLFKPFPLALFIILMGDVFATVWSFIFGRYVFYDWVKDLMSRHPKFNALDEVIKDDGWKIVVMLRLTPVPFSLITYFFSITSIRLWTVVWATCVGVLPGSCIGIWIGSLLKGLSGIDNPELETKNLVILVMNGVFIGCCVLALSIFGKRSLRKAMKRLEQHQALTNLQEVEIVIEGVATVIRELEDNASIPPSLRSTMIEQLAAEETDPNYYYRGDDLEATQRRHLGALSPPEDREGSRSNSSTTVSNTLVGHSAGTGNTTTKMPTNAASSSGFTRGEKIMFILIGIVAVLNVCICIPLYYHFAD
ncbi:hypothetical protein BX616_003241 [Lobosporangium transversale]|uniref:Snare associated Golgi protein-domain-containing protein n=1 Tax=Lobosporangium transversale TaxID=64571 RepID=A0A1Y2GZM3_9FUNG|nr:snare associated Golgi protein-domain-containing protein [Lobosporangium transversale]KAF9918991.1 hypothetical protein BX616_003241 [Lobosporangium transversale]ORZ27725.1 snare associated Golgi protein-domain-containing protein [Lobosporangium transversale]|eukprot:XP_021885428.1 snare associated Golgi protein-domain-containing protein [Lobosporangium transversale]